MWLTLAATLSAVSSTGGKLSEASGKTFAAVAFSSSAVPRGEELLSDSPAGFAAALLSSGLLVFMPISSPSGSLLPSFGSGAMTLPVSELVLFVLLLGSCSPSTAFLASEAGTARSLLLSSMLLAFVLASSPSFAGGFASSAAGLLPARPGSDAAGATSSVAVDVLFSAVVCVTGDADSSLAGAAGFAAGFIAAGFVAAGLAAAGSAGVSTSPVAAGFFSGPAPSTAAGAGAASSVASVTAVSLLLSAGATSRSRASSAAWLLLAKAKRSIGCLETLSPPGMKLKRMRTIRANRP
mmetsp:Transcript_6080/g.14106  ORF Transcript_6080/g.14106 Transcript_6080/m.14106 type:complete len:295 (+) Transcript_6080:240-1124(+)